MVASSVRRRRAVALAGALVLALTGFAALRATLTEPSSTGGQTQTRELVAPRVALQAGHWRIDELPAEQVRLRSERGAAVSSSLTEWRINRAIVRATARILRRHGIAVDTLPAKVPPAYRAAAFVTVHADGNADARVEGFKVAPSFADRSGRSHLLGRQITRS